MSYLMQKLPSFRGKKRVDALIRRIFPSQKFVTVDYCGSVIIVEPDASYSQKFVYLNADKFDQSEMVALRNVLRKFPNGGCFIDIGSHIGLYCLALKEQLTANNFRVIAIEPNDYLIPQLEFNLSKNLNIPFSVLNVALSRESGSGVMYLNEENSGESSMVPKKSSKVMQVRTETLLNVVSEFCTPNQPIIMKIDAEGHEFDILEGALDCDQINIQYILTEVTHAHFQTITLKNYLEGKGFRIEALLGENALFKRLA